MKRLLALGGCLLALAAVEILGHAFPKLFGFKPQRYEFSAELELGYACQRPIAPTAAGSRVYGAAVGDSFTALPTEIPLERMYPSVAGRKLGKTIVNLGCPGYGTLQEEIAANSALFTYRPKFLVLELFPGNDWLDNYDFTQWRMSGRDIPLELYKKVAGQAMPDSHWALLADKRFLGRSVIYTLLYNYLVVATKSGQSPGEWYRDDPHAAQIGQDQAFAALLRLKDTCAKSNTRFLVVIVRTPDTLAHGDANDAATLAFLKNNKIAFVDPKPALVADQKSGVNIFLPDNVHWNAAAQGTVGDLVARAIRGR